MKKILTIEVDTEHEIKVGKRYSFGPLPVARPDSRISCLVIGVKTLYDGDDDDARSVIEHRLDNFVERHFDHETRIKAIETDITKINHRADQVAGWFLMVKERIEQIETQIKDIADVDNIREAVSNLITDVSRLFRKFSELKYK